MEHNTLNLAGLNGQTCNLHNTVAQKLLAWPGPIEDESVDMILTDPPYIISKPTGFQAGGNPRYGIRTEFGTWDTPDGFSMDDLEEITQQMFRVLRGGATAIVFFDLWKISTLYEMMKREGFVDIDMLEWIKTNPVPINQRATYLSNAREVALVARKPGPRRTPPSPNPTRLYEYPIYAGKDRFHTTQKSLPLFAEIIEHYSLPGDLILDAFSGSATTGVAALKTGRSYLGCEPDQTYFEKSSQRLETVWLAKSGQCAG